MHSYAAIFPQAVHLLMRLCLHRKITSPSPSMNVHSEMSRAMDRVGWDAEALELRIVSMQCTKFWSGEAQATCNTQ